MSVVVTGRDLTRAALVEVARHDTRVTLDPGAVERMAATHAVLEAALERGDAIYGSSTAVGVLKRVKISGEDAAAYSARVLRTHG